MKTVKYIETEVVIAPTTHTYSFPVDMLRYDNCVFRGSEDVAKYEHFGHTGYDVGCIIRLKRYSQDGSKATQERWASFGWNVIDDTGKFK